jgi:DNA-binding LacI/PurR family transcriptional regulator
LGELALIGLDGGDAANHSGLTTVGRTLDESGRRAAELSLAHLADPIA